MRNSVIAVYGASGFGREVMPLVRKQYEKNVQDTSFVFIDDNAKDDSLMGCAVVSYPEFCKRPEFSKKVVIAIADSRTREKLVDKCMIDGIGMLSIAADNAVQLADVSVADGAILCHFTQITSNVRIGQFFHANIYSYVAHDCVIGDFVTFAPRVCCNGNVHIGDHAYIGTGAIIKQGTPGKPLVIGAGAVVGMGAVVTKDVPPGVTVIGSPARILEPSRSKT